MKKTDVIIIGSGVAALQLASQLNNDLDITILTKDNLETSNSSIAQGGVAASVGPDDSTESHFDDTMVAGCHFNDADTVRSIINQAPNLINGLLQIGCFFDKTSNNLLSLGREGAHSFNRILHAGGDQTGKFIVNSLKNDLGNTQTIEHALVYEVLVDESSNTCYGVKYKDKYNINRELHAQAIVLATGGAGQLYTYTSNGPFATGDGYILGYHAGATLTNLEFIQFHPTLLFRDGECKGLISEAVRGEGGILVNDYREKIMENFHPLADLAPRHIVSQKIYEHLQNGENIYLDVSSISDFEKKFPSITEMCRNNDISMKEGLLPVCPGAHFMIGGIKTTLKGQTSVNQLYAIGEVAHTGIHGANRLASNSLLEGLYMGKALADHINKRAPVNHEYFHNSSPKESSGLSYLPTLTELQEQMMRNVGIIRNHNQLQQMLNWLNSFTNFPLTIPSLDSSSKKEIERLFAYQLSYLITESALKRSESRGAHFRSDFPYERQQFSAIQSHFKKMRESNERVKA
ncbi:L-aspartate oxidase [Halalkalibacillus sediminis]|uniref:L-aspartate oxidase n=1 Tax=Halalkalibacillus sediminis TaxID=2018042 RepID=A0A2I0QX94_9BACI|nr:L-aspartate oxidase [Halalkalibacillus sediminis]PKR78928.1 L-aspartate oxidase [Halalkalibacillus sediminis]